MGMGLEVGTEQSHSQPPMYCRLRSHLNSLRDPKHGLGEGGGLQD